jgi:hypothetical protein
VTSMFADRLIERAGDLCQNRQQNVILTRQLEGHLA